MTPIRGPRAMLRACVRGRNPLVVSMAVATLTLAGCGTNVHFVPIPGPKIRPNPKAAYCPHPVPRALAYINLPIQVTPEADGNFLVTDGGTFNRGAGTSKVVEINRSGKAIWAYINPTLDFAHSAYPTLRGNVLISDTNNNRVIEVTRQCKIVYNSDDHYGGHGFLGRGHMSDGMRLIYPNDAKQLPNGNYLISSRGNSTVFEVNRDNHVYWKCHSFINLDGKPDHLAGQHNPQRLPDGDTLISDSNNARVVMVDRACKHEVWQFPPINHTRNPHGGERILWPRDATLMVNHDILVDDSLHNRCLEVTMRDKVVRKYYDLPQPYSCWPMPNGVVASGDSNTHGIVLWGAGAPQASPMAVIPFPGKFFTPTGHKLRKHTVPKHLINGGFETESHGTPIGWTKDDVTTETLPPGTRANMTFDKNVAHGGFSSARITWNHNTEHAPIWWGQAIRVKQYKRVKVSGWMLTKDVRKCDGCNFGLGTDRGNSAYFAVQFFYANPYAPPKLPSFPKVIGTTMLKGSGNKQKCQPVPVKDTGPGAVPSCWKHFSQTYFVPHGAKVMNIQCVLAGRGSAWFDDVVVHYTGKSLPPGGGPLG